VRWSINVDPWESIKMNKQLMVGKCEGKRPLGRSAVDDRPVQMNPKEIRLECGLDLCDSGLGLMARTEHASVPCSCMKVGELF
jgi:hypothetical protein